MLTVFVLYSISLRPSAQPRGIAAAPIRSDGRVTQSGPAQRTAVMRELGVSEEALEVRYIKCISRGMVAPLRCTAC